MAFILLGSVEPNSNWQLLGTESSSELFKVNHTWTATNWWRPRAIITQWWGDQEFSPARKIFAKETTESLIQLPIPSEFKGAGLSNRKIGVLLIPPYRGTIPPGISWTVTISHWV